MEHCILTLGTVTRAIAARRILNAARIPARLIKTAEGGGRGGCAYGLKIYASELEAADRALREAEIPFEWRWEGTP